MPLSLHKICHAMAQFSQPVAIMLNLYKKKCNIQFVFILSMEKIIIMLNVIF